MLYFPSQQLRCEQRKDQTSWRGPLRSAPPSPLATSPTVFDLRRIPKKVAVKKAPAKKVAAKKCCCKKACAKKAPAKKPAAKKPAKKAAKK